MTINLMRTIQNMIVTYGDACAKDAVTPIAPEAEDYPPRIMEYITNLLFQAVYEQEQEKTQLKAEAFKIGREYEREQWEAKKEGQ